MGALVASLSSLFWGISDFLGGTASRRAHPLAVMRVTQGLTIAPLVAVVLVAGEAGRTGAIGWGVAAGLFSCVGLAAFYAALAAGTMGIVAPVAALGAVIPVVVGLAQGESPRPAQMAGIVVAIAGVVLASGPERVRTTLEPSTGDPGGGAGPAPAAPAELRVAPAVPTLAPTSPWRPLALAGLAAAAFGSVLAVVAEGSEVSVAMTLLAMRVTNALACALLLATAFRRATRPARADRRTLAAIAVTDLGAHTAYAMAVGGSSSVAISAVLASLYPAVTALLAWRVHGEHLARTQVAGVVAVLGGVALIAGG